MIVSTVAGASPRAQSPSGSTPPARGTDPTREAELVKQALAQFQAGQASLPDAKAPQATLPGQDRPVLSLTADESVRRAIANNLDLAVERLNPELQQLAFDQVQASYVPTLTALFSETSNSPLPTSQLTGGQKTKNLGTNWNAGMTKNVPWFGGSWAASLTNGRTDTTSQFATLNPQYQTAISLTYTQPLWRNFKIDSTRQQLLTTKISKDIADLQLRSVLINTEANTRNAYWDLWHAIRALQAARNSLALAEKLVEDNKVRVEIGTLAPLDVVSAEAEAATRRQNVAVAEATWRTAELALKRLVVGSTADPLWNAQIDPTDLPTIERRPVDLVGALRNALSQRIDLLQARRQLESNDISIRYLKNQLVPQTDLVATYGLRGLGGTQLERAPGLGGAILSTIPGGWVDALRGVGRVDYPNWVVQLNFSYPLGKSAADTSYARAKVQYIQAQAQIRSLELQVATDITNAALNVESTERRLDAASAARQLAEKKLEAEQSKFEVGMSTNFFVVQAQRDLLDAQITELRASLDYRKALVDLERLQLTTSTRTSITTVSSGGGGTTTATSSSSTRTGG